MKFRIRRGVTRPYGGDNGGMCYAHVVAKRLSHNNHADLELNATLAQHYITLHYIALHYTT